MLTRKITNVLISVFNKENVCAMVDALASQGVQFLSTGGTQTFLQQRGHRVESVEDITNYPSLFGGRVKTLHPAIFGGILFRRDDQEDIAQAHECAIRPIDMVVVDLYPFQETVEEKKDHEAIIEKIDIGGISLIRAAAKNYRDVLTVSSSEWYDEAVALIRDKKGFTDLEERKTFAGRAFATAAHYDRSISHYFNDKKHTTVFDVNTSTKHTLRYGENPHQTATYYGDLDDMLEQLHGVELSYNNLIDIDAALQLLHEFEEQTTFVIIKHTNACGVAIGNSVKHAYGKAIEADKLSAFGGVLASNKTIDLHAAEAIHELFFEVLVAPDYEPEALAVLQSKKKRRLIRTKNPASKKTQFKSVLNGIIEQDIDTGIAVNLKKTTKRPPTSDEKEALLFANKIAKHTKSNAIVLAKKNQMIASGAGQTSRIDALRYAIDKAKRSPISLQDAVMASDAFFPFPDCVEMAYQEGIKAVIHPGGSVRDGESIAFCDRHEMTMVTTGFRHFRH